MEIRIADYQDYQNYISAQFDKEQEQVDRELRDQDDTTKMCEQEYLVGLEELNHLV